MSKDSRYLFLVGNGIDGPIKTFLFCFVFSSLREGDEDLVQRNIFHFIHCFGFLIMYFEMDLK